MAVGRRHEFLAFIMIEFCATLVLPLRARKARIFVNNALKNWNDLRKPMKATHENR
jgi:hypothetical protein